MNLLPKKSWHVRTRKNIERVQRDEAEGERAAEVELGRRLRVEQELRLEELRRRAGINSGGNPSGGTADGGKRDDGLTQATPGDNKRPPVKHFDLFEGLEQGPSSSATLDRRRAANAANQQARLVRAADVSQPWYSAASRPPGRPASKLKSAANSALEQRPEGTSARRGRAACELVTSMYDPMTAIKQAESLHKQRKAERRRREAASSRQL